jgi:hypothetical protein
MKLQIKTHGCTLSPGDEREMERHLAQLEPVLTRFDPDLVHLDVEIEKQARRAEYTCALRLTIMEQVLAAHRNAAPKIHTLLNYAFDDLRERLARMDAQLRHEADWERKRGGRSGEDLKRTERELIELRAALDQALATDPTAFAVLADTRLPAVRRILYEAMTHEGHQPAQEELDRALVQVLAAAQQDLRSKPDRWSLFGWLAWVARRELDRRAGLTV